MHKVFLEFIFLLFLIFHLPCRTSRGFTFYCCSSSLRYIPSWPTLELFSCDEPGQLAPAYLKSICNVTNVWGHPTHFTLHKEPNNGGHVSCWCLLLVFLLPHASLYCGKLLISISSSIDLLCESLSCFASMATCHCFINVSILGV